MVYVGVCDCTLASDCVLDLSPSRLIIIANPKIYTIELIIHNTNSSAVISGGAVNYFTVLGECVSVGEIGVSVRDVYHG